jgi:hypothetical protein
MDSGCFKNSDGENIWAEDGGSNRNLHECTMRRLIFYTLLVIFR